VHYFSDTEQTTVNDPRTRQARFNAESRGQWAGFAPHRDRVTALLSAGAGPRATRLCVLGAGNANDLDLPALLTSHREVHLVDLDPEALALGASRQGVEGHPGLRLFGGLDLTGVLDTIASWSPSSTVRADAVARFAEGPELRVAPALPGPYDAVASTCLLSQLIGNAHHSVGESHPRFHDLVRATRAGHLRLLTALTAPGGTATLITDVASTDTFPPLRSLPEAELPAVFPRLAASRLYFHGVDPAAVTSAFRDDPVVRPRVAALGPVAPWKWSLHDRVYLVWAVRFQRANG
jgi:hypothetical protein